MKKASALAAGTFLLIALAFCIWWKVSVHHFTYPSESPKCDPSIPQGVNSNGVDYVCSKSGVWVIDMPAMEEKAKRQQHIDQLYWGLRTRVLSDSEMKEVRDLGLMLIIHDMTPYYDWEKREELNQALFRQFEMRLEAMEHKSLKPIDEREWKAMKEQWKRGTK